MEGNSKIVQIFITKHVDLNDIFFMIDNVAVLKILNAHYIY